MYIYYYIYIYVHVMILTKTGFSVWLAQIYTSEISMIQIFIALVIILDYETISLDIIFVTLEDRLFGNGRSKMLNM